MRPAKADVRTIFGQCDAASPGREHNCVAGFRLQSRGGRTRTGDLVVPNHARYQLRHAPELRSYNGFAFSASASRRNASPRWLTRCFSSGVSSANVLPSSSK